MSVPKHDTSHSRAHLQLPDNSYTTMIPSTCRRIALNRAILTAVPTLIPIPDGGRYEFHRVPFGERGDYIEAELLSEILGGLADIARHAFPSLDVVLCPEPGGHTWAWRSPGPIYPAGSERYTASVAGRYCRTSRISARSLAITRTKSLLLTT